MSKHRELEAEALAALKAIEGLRIDLDEGERLLCEKEAGELPSLARLLVGATHPSAIVRPKTEAEVAAVIGWASKRGIHLVPRAAATSSHGGALPSDGAVVVDLLSLDRILSIDEAKMTATVEPGIAWDALGLQLAPRGLAPRMVPASAPCATVGGWLAQGGGGLGSYQYGWFDQNVLSATSLHLDGSRETLSGRAVELLAGAMGTTGIMTSVTIRLRKSEAESVFAIEALTISKLQEIIEQSLRQGLPIWHAGFMNPATARLMNHEPSGSRPALPESYLMLAACPESKASEAEPMLKAVVAEAGASWLPDATRDYLWGERFKPMKARRTSTLGAEVAIPLSALSLFHDRLDALIYPSIVVEGTVVKGEELILRCLVPCDSRKYSRNLAYILSLSILRLAKRLGGRAYSSGLYLAPEANAVHGMRRRLWQNYKRDRDRLDLMNPRKLSGIRRMNLATSLALWLEPLLRILGNTLNKRRTI